MGDVLPIVFEDLSQKLIIQVVVTSACHPIILVREPVCCHLVALVSYVLAASVGIPPLGLRLDKLMDHIRVLEVLELVEWTRATHLLHVMRELHILEVALWDPYQNPLRGQRGSHSSRLSACTLGGSHDNYLQPQSLTHALPYHSPASQALSLFVR